MTRTLLLLSILAATIVACAGDDAPASPDAVAVSPDAGQECPNAIASDENCGGCLKDHGAGASYCAASCTGDDDCAGMTSGWGDVALVCHPDGYCTRGCSEAWECDLGDGGGHTCDDGRCTVCIDCY